MRNTKKNLFQIHLAIFLVSFSGIIQEFISLPIEVITLGRVIVASLSLSFFLVITKMYKKIRDCSIKTDNLKRN